MPDPDVTLDLDPVTSAVLFAVARLGYVVSIRQDGELSVAAANVGRMPATVAQRIGRFLPEEHRRRPAAARPRRANRGSS